MNIKLIVFLALSLSANQIFCMRGYRTHTPYCAPDGQPQNPPYFMPHKGPLSPLAKSVMFLDHQENLFKLINEENINKEIYSRSTPLMLAIEYYGRVLMRGFKNAYLYKETIAFLIKSGANVNTKSSYNNITALMLASFHDLSDIAALLIQNGADPKAVDAKGRNFLNPVYNKFKPDDLLIALKIVLKKELDLLRKNRQKIIMEHFPDVLSNLVLDYTEPDLEEMIGLFN